MLQSSNLAVTVISLDNWLVPVSGRTESMTVRERFVYESIEADIHLLIHGSSVSVKKYDPYSREISGDSTIACTNPGVLIVEGVPALDIEGLRKMSDIRIYCESGEHDRRKRFFSFYRWKEMQEPEIQDLYETRLRDELPIIEHSRKYADFVLDAQEIRNHKRS
jgi:uridine kinase